MTRKRLSTMIAMGTRTFRHPYYQGFSAQLSFYMTVAIVPLIILISQLLQSVFQISMEDAVSWIFQSTKANGVLGTNLESLLTNQNGGAITNAIYIIIAVWAASGAQFSLSRVANYTFTNGHSTGHGYVKERFRSILNMFVFLIILVGALLVFVFGTKIVQITGGSMLAWQIVRWPIALILYFIMVLYNYYMLPTKKIKLKKLIPGSIFAAAGMVIITMIYSLYVNAIAHYNIIYGMLGTIVAFMVWFYFIAWVLSLGILLNKVWMDTERGKPVTELFL